MSRLTTSVLKVCRYRAVDEGKQLLGEFDNNIWSGRVGVKLGAHSVALSHQRNNGNDDFDYLRQSDSIFLDNSIRYSDFNSPKERSWMVRQATTCATAFESDLDEVRVIVEYPLAIL